MSIESGGRAALDPSQSAGMAYRSQQRSGRKRKWLWPTVGAVGALAFFFLILYLFLRMSGSVHGEEFSPDTFDQRTFYYNKMPLTGWIVYKRRLDNYTSAVAQHIIAAGYIKTIKNDPQVWHLVEDSKSSRSSPDFDARILVDILEAQNSDGEFVWMDWCMDHKKCSAILWPEVARLARDYEYWAIPDLMDLATAADESNTTAFQTKVQQYVSEIYVDQAQRLIDDKKNEKALHYLDQAIEVMPSADAYRLRASVHRELGNAEKAGEDETKANALSE